MSFTFKAEAYEAQLKPGVYPATLRSIEERQKDQDSYLIWKFAVQPKKGPEVEVSTLSSTKCSPKAKARQFIEALLGRPMTRGEEFAPAMLYGKPCQLVVSIQTYDDGGSRNTIERVLPVEAEGEEDVPL
jgi:hypothetical protein